MPLPLFYLKRLSRRPHGNCLQELMPLWFKSRQPVRKGCFGGLRKAFFPWLSPEGYGNCFDSKERITLVTALTIAGSDCSGGAGIQADLKTMTAHKVYGMSAITALTAQNTTGVSGILEVPPEFLAQQLDSIFTDIPPQAVKIGMVSSAELIRVIGEKLEQYHASHIVLDPVMVATSGARLIKEDAVEALCRYLIPLAEVITPNIPEAEKIAGMEIKTAEDMKTAAKKIADMGAKAVLVKGGHYMGDAQDILYDGSRYHTFVEKRIHTKNTHGTGCTLSSAIASYLALGESLPDAVKKAKEYVTGAIEHSLELGKGCGPTNHFFRFYKG